MEYDANSWEESLIADVRANGRPTSGPLRGHPILIMYGRGAKTGEPRRAILTFSRDGDAYVVAGSAGGSPKDPAWLANVKAHPDIEIEVGSEERIPARATIVEGADRERLWDAHVAALPWFAPYPAQAGRPIPVVRLTPKA